MKRTAVREAAELMSLQEEARGQDALLREVEGFGVRVTVSVIVPDSMDGRYRDVVCFEGGVHGGSS